ncbi:alpha/beta fold hydrolase [uncultured Jatrophihabitans sp.]|uniref:alpha/beta fold hydrolase n=1 Tax=uncultured Jatrophihabitans sp. TaxID=1610747 RepID=UPI0035C9FB5E
MSSPTVVLVHGGFVDGSGWKGVYDELKSTGLEARIVQNPTKSLADDAVVTRNVLDTVDGPVVLVGHSYGGAVISEAGTHPNVAALVYVTAFAPDTGESVGSIIDTFPKDGPQPPILPPVNGFLFLDRAKFADSFAGDVSTEDAEFMANSQVPWGLDAISGTVTDAAWRSKPSWYLHVTDDRMIPPAQQLAMAERSGAAITDTPGSHAIYVSQPTIVADLIRSAAHSATD